MKTGFVEVNGAQLYYEVKGAGQPVLMLHGYPLDSRMWDYQFEELAKDFQVIRFDYAGAGKSEAHNQDFSLVEDIKDLLAFLGVEKVNIIGLSVGGNLAMDFTLTYPELVEKLILVSTGLLGWSKFSLERQQYNATLRECIDEKKVIELMCKAWVAGPFRSVDEIQPEIIEKYSTMLRTNLARENGKGKIILPETKTIDRVCNITKPTLIISPDVDFPDFEAIADFLHKKIKGSEKVVIPGTAHLLNMEKPREFNELVLNFLNN
ncbi:alpha/beta fold hydrolase [Neobacillus mesonae]|uniref:alpha/beta fold hydrolase n=1 Tax=Neobacillus mesonae TaxID=1193713 RepID=UPI0025735FAB|nr:alpha/beta hydrolase [Neobacillus mesonae]MED4203015.1 alpha/beta hydrolase [Neobacillus mesonae]